MTESLRLLETVVRGGYCIGCGACAAVARSPLHIITDDLGRYQAALKAKATATTMSCNVLSVCPFSDEGPNEDEIGERLFGRHCSRSHSIGYYLATYAGYVADQELRRNSSSGGIVTSVLTELFERGLVDGVIHVRKTGQSAASGPLFAMTVSRSRSDIIHGAKSRYYPVELSQVLREVKCTPGRYALVGLPCFVKAVRLMCQVDDELAQRIRFCIGIFCGHLKTSHYANMLGWQYGILPGDLTDIEFRRKIAGTPPNKYRLKLAGAVDSGALCDGVEDQYSDSVWPGGFFKYPACDYCDDIAGETADMSCGDAWLSQYLQDCNGTSIMIIRSQELHGIVREAQFAGRLLLKGVSPADVARSQDGCFRHRRPGLAYRLFLKDQKALWRPKKRVSADAQILDSRARHIQDLRLKISALSHTAFQEALSAGQFAVFEQRMSAALAEYVRAYRPPLWRIDLLGLRLAGGCRRRVSRWLLHILHRAARVCHPNEAKTPRAGDPRATSSK
ncbi:MAG: Coenzyme F420 hydrogenase/dehydrogenase, beta subunit C-terminal domain [Verrucomicrobiota bacterium]